MEDRIPTEAERAANYREVHKLSRGERFALMFGRLHQIKPEPMIEQTCPKCGNLHSENYGICMNHETIKKSDGITFEQWFEALRMYAGSIHPQHIQYVDDTRQSWFDYYEDDDTPKFALDEDMSYWE